MGTLALAAKITHVPSMYLSELDGPRKGTRQDAIDGHREIGRRCRALGVGAVVVLGHPSYYPRFGFQPSVRFGIVSEYDAPPEAFMVLELQPGYLSGASGTVKFHAAFQDA